jgi:hypothetical protein
MVSLRVVTQPICEPVPLAQMKQHLRVSIDDDDTLISVYMQAAREWCESYTNRSFIKKTYEMRLAWLPLFDYRQQGYVTGNAPNPGWYNGLWVADSLKIKLLRPNLIPGSSQIVYQDLNGNPQTMVGVTDYQEGAYSEPAILTTLSGLFWPWTQYNNPNAAVITYDAGMGDEAAIQAALAVFNAGSPPPTEEESLAEEISLRQAAIPGWVQAAIMHMTAHLYEHREAVSEIALKEAALGLQSLLGMYMVDDFSPTRG